jgi:DNA-binding response OmpR family regulator
MMGGFRRLGLETGGKPESPFPVGLKTMVSERSTVLVVEDDAPIRRGLVDSLKYAGYAAVECADGKTAIAQAADPSVNLVLLDVMLPDIDGFTILSEVRKTRPTLPIIMVTARGAEEDRVRGLRDGADDYVVKPFSAKELLARVEAVLRRAPESWWGVRSLLQGECQINLEERRATRPDVSDVYLTEREASLLRYLAANGNRVVDRRELFERVWGINPNGIETRTVDMHVARLREKIEDDPAHPQIVLTVRGVGYRLAETVVTERI